MSYVHGAWADRLLRLSRSRASDLYGAGCVWRSFPDRQNVRKVHGTGGDQLPFLRGNGLPARCAAEPIPMCWRVHRLVSPVSVVLLTVSHADCNGIFEE